MPGVAPTRPVLASLAGYRPAWIKGDLAAGLAIAAVGLPTAIAYPAIAGLPPQAGLYARSRRSSPTRSSARRASSSSVPTPRRSR